MNTLYFFIIMSSLLVSGCFSSPTKEEAKVEKMHILWQYAYDFDGGAPKVRPLIYQNQIITSGDIKITALDYSTGQQLWKTPFTFSRQLMNETFGVVNNVIVGSIADKILAWNISTGDFLWEVIFSDSISLNHIAGITGASDNFIAVGHGVNHIYKINQQGDIEIINLDSRSFETTVSEGVLYAGQRKGDPGVGVFSAYDVDTMELLWRFTPGEFLTATRVPPIIEDGIVYVGTAEGPNAFKSGFFALDAQTGEELWRHEDIFTYSAVLVDDYLYIHDAGGIYKLRKSDGGLEWYSDFSGNGTGPITYGYGYIYSNHSGIIYIVDAETGEIVHKFGPPEGSYFWLVTVEKGRVFAQSNRHLYAFAPWGHTEPLEE